MKFSDWFLLREQGTVGLSKMGGPSASGRLGESPTKPGKPQTAPPSNMTPGTKMHKVVLAASPFSPGGGFKKPFPRPPGPMSPGINIHFKPPGSNMTPGIKNNPDFGPV